jgi:RNA polymerase sigma factor (sigma-70 family)
MSQTIDSAALTEYTPGSEADFERLYQNTYNRVLGTLVGMLGDVAAAEDCCHEAYERAYKKWADWRPDAPAEAWVHRIAVNGAISYIRWAKLRNVGEVIRRLGRPGPGQDPAAMAERSDLVAALKQLPPKQAAVIVLRHYHGYTSREIAQALNVPERTVASRLAAAKSRLRDSLEPLAKRSPLELDVA